MITNALACDIGRCHAECCGPVPIPKRLFEEKRHLLQREVEVLEAEDLPGVVMPFDKNLTCGFLTKDFRCAIYNDRPEVCKKFGSIAETHEMLICPHKKSWASESKFLAR